MKIKYFLLILVIICLGKNVYTQIINTIAGTGVPGYNGDGIPGTSAQLFRPIGVALDAAGNVYIADRQNYRIRKITVSTGTISTIAGTGTFGFSGDGGPATAAQLYNPTGVALDTSGNIYFTEPIFGNRIRKITVSTGIITTIAGTGNSGYNGDGIPATSAELNAPWGISIDVLGNVYIGDQTNNRIRKITTATGIITTIAGTGTAGYSGDGGIATAADLNWPAGVALDKSGNIYITDKANHRIRKITASSGIITTLAGTGTASFSGDGGISTSAELNNPIGIVLDTMENIYFVDNSTRIRKIIKSTGLISTIAGIGIAGYNGEGIPADSAQLDASGIAIDSIGNIYLGETQNYRVRKIDFNMHAGIQHQNNIVNSVSVFPNPFFRETVLRFAYPLKNAMLTVENYFGQSVTQMNHVNGQTVFLNRDHLSSGLYLVRLIQDNKIIATAKLVITDN